MKTDTNTLIDALRILARDIHSEDGIAFLLVGMVLVLAILVNQILKRL